MHDDVSLFPVAVAALLPLVIGALWYSPLLFAKPWMRAHGHTSESLAAMRPRMVRIYGLSLAAYLVVAFALAQLLHWTGQESVAGGIHLAAFCWLGFAATLGLTAHLFSEKPPSAYFIDAGFQLVALIAIGAVIGGWR
jgi:hypothetical protein